LPGADKGPLGSVLVFDDDEDVRHVFTAGLEPYGYLVHEAPNGPAALHMLEQDISVDVAVVDFAMPIMNGAALAEASTPAAGLADRFRERLCKDSCVRRYPRRHDLALAHSDRRTCRRSQARTQHAP
jgi:hypothetical protein